MRYIRALLALLILAAPLAVAAQPAAANEGIPFAGPCLMSATATFSPSQVRVDATGTCTLNGITTAAAFNTTVSSTGPASCAAAIGIGGGWFTVGAPFGIVADPA